MDQKSDLSDYIFGITEDQLLGQILPNLYDIHDLVKQIDGNEVLFPIDCSKRVSKASSLLQSQKIVIRNETYVQFHDVNSFGDCVGVIIKLKSNNYICVFITTTSRCAYFVDSSRNTFENYPSIFSKFKRQLPAFHVIHVEVQSHRGHNSLSHAYLNARALIFGWLYYNTDKQWQTYLLGLYNEKLVSEENANKFPEYIINPNETRDDLSDGRQHLILDSIEVYVGKRYTLSKVKGKLPKPDCKIEELFIEQNYLKFAFEAFLIDTEAFVTRNVNSLHLIQSLFCGSHFRDISEPLKVLPSYSLLIEPVDALQAGCWIFQEYKEKVHTFWRSINVLSDEESGFLKVLSQMLVQSFLQERVSFSLDIDTTGDPTEVTTDFIDFILTSHDPVFKALKISATNVGEVKNTSHTFCRNLVSELRDWNVKQLIHMEKSSNFPTESVLLCKTAYMDMARHLDKIETCLAEDNYKEVHIVTTRCLHVNCDLKWPGINLVILANNIDISHRKNVWDVSGENGNCFSERATDGDKAGDDGRAGKSGHPGESGGNVEIWYRSISGLGSNLEIVSNGGNGGSGQDGGYGRDGKDGEDGSEITEEEFNKKFPPVATMSHATYKRNRQTYHKHAKVENHIDHRYYKMISNEGGNKITFSIYQNFAAAIPLGLGSFRQAYCLYEGGEGTLGQRGGDGGIGGSPGPGGYAGEVNIACFSAEGANRILESTIVITHQHGYAGEHGQSGEGGENGRNGRRGRDIGRMEPTHRSKPKVLQGRLKIVPHDSYSKAFPFCKQLNKYVEIVCVPQEAPARKDSVKKKTSKVKTDI